MSATITQEVRNYMAEIGRKGGLIGGKVGGKSTSKRKQDASRHNGHKGGRPKKQLDQTPSESVNSNT